MAKKYVESENLRRQHVLQRFEKYILPQFDSFIADSIVYADRETKSLPSLTIHHLLLFYVHGTRFGAVLVIFLNKIYIFCSTS